MIFLDSNIPMYLIGAPHRLQAESQILLERVVAAGERIVTDAEVFQEILHRYTAIERCDAIGPAFRKADVLRAGEIVQHPAGLSARDAVHPAVMERQGVTRILSFDAGFDRWPGVTRMHEM